MSLSVVSHRRALHRIPELDNQLPETLAYVTSVLEPLVGKIPGLLHLEIRRTFSGMDYALYSEFGSREDLENYAVHPLHQEAKTHFFHLLDSRVAADYEV